MDINGKIIGVNKIAERFKLNPHTVRAWLKKGMPHERAGWFVVFSTAKVEKWLKENGKFISEG